MSGPPDAAALKAGLSTHRAGDFTLESGETLRDVRQAYRLEGEIDADGGNVVLLFHSLTGSPADLGGWSPFVGEGLPIDTRRFAVLAPNLLGSCYGTRFLRGAGHAGRPLAVTTRDMARLAGLLVADLGISRLALVAGGSLGGMVTLEYCATFPEGVPGGDLVRRTRLSHRVGRGVESRSPDGDRGRAPVGPRPRTDGRDAHLPDAGGDRTALPPAHARPPTPSATTSSTTARSSSAASRRRAT